MVFPDPDRPASPAAAHPQTLIPVHMSTYLHPSPLQPWDASPKHVCVLLQGCAVVFTSEASRAAAHPPNVLGDILGDLPVVDNFCFADSAEYE